MFAMRAYSLFLTGATHLYVCTYDASLAHFPRIIHGYRV